VGCPSGRGPTCGVTGPRARRGGRLRRRGGSGRRARRIAQGHAWPAHPRCCSPLIAAEPVHREVSQPQGKGSAPRMWRLREPQHRQAVAPARAPGAFGRRTPNSEVLANTDVPSRRTRANRNRRPARRRCCPVQMRCGHPAPRLGNHLAESAGPSGAVACRGCVSRSPRHSPTRSLERHAECADVQKEGGKFRCTGRANALGHRQVPLAVLGGVRLTGQPRSREYENESRGMGSTTSRRLKG
jgi:hypothetical protein